MGLGGSLDGWSLVWVVGVAKPRRDPLIRCANERRQTGKFMVSLWSGVTFIHFFIQIQCGSFLGDFSLWELCMRAW